MTNIPTALQTSGRTVAKWDYLGNMGNTGASAVHLHFVTRKKLANGTYQTVDPYGHKPNWPGNTADDPNNPYLWQ